MGFGGDALLARELTRMDATSSSSFLVFDTFFEAELLLLFCRRFLALIASGWTEISPESTFLRSSAYDKRRINADIS